MELKHLILWRKLMAFHCTPMYPSETLNLWLSLSAKDMNCCKLPFARTVVIAEAGAAHQGSLSDACDLVVTAAKAGADVVKFQAFDNPTKESMFCWINGDEERSDWWRSSRLSYKEWEKVKDLCDERGINLMLSCFENKTIQWADQLRLPCMKVASRAAKNFPYKEWYRHFLISFGMWRPGAKALAALPESSTFMQCTSEYPSEDRWVGAHPGYSCHSKEPFRAIEAIRGCAAFVEVHFQGDVWPGPDEPVSLIPVDLVTVCEARDYYYKQRQSLIGCNREV